MSAIVGELFRLSPGIALGAGSGRTLGAALRVDPAFGGKHRVVGTLAIDGTPVVPVRRRVRLYDRLTGRLVREAWSEADGTWEFAQVAAREYVVIADDYTRSYNAVVADAVAAVP